MNQEKISVILIGKNDNYGGNLKHRFTHCLNILSEAFEEIIYVDWKSNGISLIEEVIENIKNKNKVKSYIVTEKDIEKNCPEYINYSIVEVLARNIGIRRASNEWILVTNVDVLIENLNLTEFNKQTLYTSARIDIPEEFHLNFNNSFELLNSIKKNENSFKKLPDAVVNGKSVWDSGDIWSLVVGCGDFQFAHKNVWYGIKGFEESFGGRCYADSNLMKKGAIYFNIEKASVPLYHLNHGTTKISLDSEILPMNDRFVCVNNFTNTLNSENWGWNNYNLKTLKND
jgi:hypothetical protein